jgi:hypothetical protein
MRILIFMGFVLFFVHGYPSCGSYKLTPSQRVLVEYETNCILFQR